MNLRVSDTVKLVVVETEELREKEGEFDTVEDTKLLRETVRQVLKEYDEEGLPLKETLALTEAVSEGSFEGDEDREALRDTDTQEVEDIDTEIEVIGEADVVIESVVVTLKVCAVLLLMEWVAEGLPEVD